MYEIVQGFSKRRLFCVLSDRSTDCFTKEQICNFVLYFDPKPMEKGQKGKVRMRFLGLRHMTTEDGVGNNYINSE